MATVNQINESTTVNASETFLLGLCETIFKARDFATVEQTIADASMIRFGLKALNNTQAELIPQDREKIVVSLNKLCNIFSQQTIPTITI